MNTQEEYVLTVFKVLLGKLPEADKLTVLKSLFAYVATQLSSEDRQALLLTLPAEQSAKLSPPAQKEYPDNRDDFPPHRAIDFKVTQDRQIQTGDLLEKLLGKDAAILRQDWGVRINFDKDAPSANQAVLFRESNNKARNRAHAKTGDKTTQEEDFKAAGLDFADDTQATIVCATLVRKAKDAGLDISKGASTWKSKQPDALVKLNESEIDLLTKLRDGVVRSRSGALGVGDLGRLRACFFNGAGGFANFWAFGGVSPAESKKA